MFIASKNNILIPGTKGQAPVRIPRGYVGKIPDWVGDTAYFKALVKCGKITVSDPGKAKKPRKASTKSPREDEPAEAPELPAENA